MKRQRKSKLLSPKEIKAIDMLVAGLVRRRLRIEAAAALVSNTVPHLRYLHDEREMRFFIERQYVGRCARRRALSSTTASRRKNDKRGQPCGCPLFCVQLPPSTKEPP